MNRRDMLKAGVAAGALGLAPRLASAGVTFAPTPKGWRSYVMTMRVEPTDGATKAWIPLPTVTPLYGRLDESDRKNLLAIRSRQRHPDIGEPSPRRMALNRVGQTHAERLYREL